MDDNLRLESIPLFPGSEAQSSVTSNSPCLCLRLNQNSLYGGEGNIKLRQRLQPSGQRFSKEYVPLNWAQTRPPDANSEIEKHKDGFQAQSASLMRIGCTPAAEDGGAPNTRQRRPYCLKIIVTLLENTQIENARLVGTAVPRIM